MVQVVTAAAVAAGAAYLIWRLGWTGDGTQPVLFWSLWLAEVALWASLVRSAYEMWRLTVDVRIRLDDPPSVDVVVVCRTEPVEVLRATLLGARTMKGPHRTFALDTEGRDDLARLVDSLGGVSLLRAERHDPAEPVEECINAVLGQLDGELVSIVHAEDVPLPDMLRELVGDFADPDVWLAQGRHEVYGPSAGEVSGGAADLALFFDAVLPGKNFHDAVYWCGSGAVLRRRAVDDLGGIPTDTDTPTFQLSLAAHAAGWRSTYHHHPVVLTLARPDVDGFVAERAMWAEGNLRSLRTSVSPLWVRGLKARQRVSYLATLLTYLGGPRRLAICAVLTATLLSGDLPVRADVYVLVSVWVLWVGLMVLARRLLGRGSAGPLGTTRHHWLLMGAHVAAWLSLLLPRSTVRSLHPPPPVAGVAHHHRRVPVRLLTLALAAVALAALARLATVAGLLDLPEMGTAAAAVALVAAAAIVGSVGLLLAESSTLQRRAAPRFPVEGSAMVDRTRARLLEVSERGCSVQLPRPATVGQPLVATLEIPGLDGSARGATVAAVVRSVRPVPDGERGYVVGMEFTHLSATARSRLAEYCRVLLPARVAAGSFGPPLGTPPERAVAGRPKGAEPATPESAPDRRRTGGRVTSPAGRGRRDA